MTDAGSPASVVGVGVSSRANAEEVRDLVASALTDAGLSTEHVRAVATVAARADHPAIVALGWPVVAVRADALAEIDVATPSERALATVGVPSVAEAAALLVAGPDATLAVPKRRSHHATVAIAVAIVATADDQPS